MLMYIKNKLTEKSFTTILICAVITDYCLYSIIIIIIIILYYKTSTTILCYLII